MHFLPSICRLAQPFMAATLLLGGCAAGPDFKPDLSLFSGDHSAEHYLNAQNEEGSAPIVMTRWWEALDDDGLKAMIHDLLAQNLTLRQAEARIAQAQASLTIVRGDSLPAVSAEGSGARSFDHNTATGQHVYSNAYEAGLNVSWQIDLFGQIRRQRESAFASFMAAELDHEALIHSYVASLVTQRMAVAALQDHVATAVKEVKNRQNFYDLIAMRYERGASSVEAADQYAAEQALAAAQRAKAGYEQELAEALYGIDVLLGLPPGETPPARYEHFDLMAEPDALGNVCLPVDLIDRRPDLRASMLRVKAANADIGVAMADLYPQLSLNAVLSSAASAPASLLDDQSLAGALSGAIAARLFEGGALRANIDLQEAEARELAAAYQQDILEALQDVENALSGEKTIAKQLRYAKQAEQAQSKVKALRAKRYDSGNVTLQTVLEAEQSYYEARHIAIDIAQARWANRIALYLALGGDWLGDEVRARRCSAGLRLADFSDEGQS